MSTKPVFPCALLLALAGVGAVRAQNYGAPPGPPAGTPLPVQMTATNEVPPPTEVHPPTPPDKYITYCCPECCGPVGGDGPVKYELFVRTGPSLVVGGGAPAGTLADGWMVEGGGRSLFVDADPVRAWTVELSLSHTYNEGNRPNIMFVVPVNIDVARRLSPASPFTMGSAAALQRTDVNAGFGREWWLLGNACSCSGWNWRAGGEAGFRYGVTRLDLHVFTQNPNLAFSQHDRATSINYGPYAAVHTDVEYPCGCCTFFGGLRAEWDYTRMNVYPLRNNDLYDVNLLLNLGVRY